MPTVDDLYVEMSGTSMAAPHVAGLLAAFLSLRREFIGYPDRAKSLLLNGCIDLGTRSVYARGGVAEPDQDAGTELKHRSMVRARPPSPRTLFLSRRFSIRTSAKVSLSWRPRP